ncbi:hypothetical protein [Peribacillus acanthi]|uniref:hypothetical protein n=1 Tax=Peribacillus acanthi TaxID=2171554 RepID=UPI000D3E637D|nr:hypothetical protein [Peribacillus acanthi]
MPKHHHHKKDNGGGQNGQNGNPSQFFANSVSIGTEVTVILEGGTTITGVFRGILNGTILVANAYIDPSEIVAFRLA